jgi:transposase
MLKRNGNVYTQIVKHCSIAEILPIIESRTSPRLSKMTANLKLSLKNEIKNLKYIKIMAYNQDYVPRTDAGFDAWQEGIFTYTKRHYRIKHSDNEFANGHNHINGIENFWGLCKVRLSKYRGIHKHKFYLHLKECEFRYNNRNTDIYKYLLKVIKENPIKLS